MEELTRALRHAIGPLTTYAVAKGWLPESAHSDVTELLVIGLGFAIPYGLSWLRDQRRGAK